MFIGCSISYFDNSSYIILIMFISTSLNPYSQYPFLNIYFTLLFQSPSAPSSAIPVHFIHTDSFVTNEDSFNSVLFHSYTMFFQFIFPSQFLHLNIRISTVVLNNECLPCQGYIRHIHHNICYIKLEIRPGRLSQTLPKVSD